jgi:CRP-like cAMP-binding protein
VTTTEPTTLFVLAHREFHSLMDQSAEVRRCVFDAMAKRIRTHEEMSAL